MTRRKKTAKQKVKPPVPVPPPDAPVLVKVGENYINPADVSAVRAVKKGTLYIVKFRDDPNPEFPCWVKPEDIGALLARFRLIEGEEQ